MQQFENEVLNDNFTTEKKAAAFESIAKLYYNRNFGTATKSDIDLLMFKIYMEAAIENHLNPDNSIDYSACSDYKMGIVLGISPTKVRNLKLKKELIYPQENFDWKVSLRHILSVPENIRADEKSLKVNIPDPNLFNAIQDYIEDMGGCIDIQLNKKVLCVQKKYLLDLIYIIAESENERKAIEDSVDKALRNTENITEFDSSDLLHKIKKASSIGADFLIIITNILKIFPPNTYFYNLLNNILKLL